MTWRRKLVFSAVTVGLFFALLELGLGLAGARPLYLTRDPFVGFQPGVPLFVRDGDVMRTNPAKLAFFNPQRFRAEKPAGGYRVFCLGGSTTFGHPYDARTAFGRWLEVSLEEAAPDRTFEVVNAGGISYASYRESLLMLELVRYQPDLFVVCTGHNEFLEERTYGPVRSRGPLGRAAGWLVSRSRTGSVLAQLLRPRVPSAGDGEGLLKAEVETILERSVGIAAYSRDDERARQVVAHFRFSLERMAALARSAGARVVFVAPPSNVRDFSPFKSEHGEPGAGRLALWEETAALARRARAEGRLAEAADAWRRAAELDPRHAQGLWEAGEAHFAAGRFAEAHRFFTRAIDEDVCPLRATSALRTAMAEAARRTGVPLVDWQRLLEARLDRPAEQRILGNESMLDHVHPTIDGHRVLGWALHDWLAAEGIVPRLERTPERTARLSKKVLSDSRSEGRALVQVIQVLLWAGKAREALALAERAEAVEPGLSDVATYRGRILEKLGRHDEAFALFQEAVRRDPKDALARMRLASACLRRDLLAEARESFVSALAHMPAAAPDRLEQDTRMGLGVTLARMGDLAGAREELRKVVAEAPERPDARSALERVEAALAGAGRAKPTAGGGG